jgi:hypothetical protein
MTMKKLMIALTLLLAASTASAQYWINPSMNGGYTVTGPGQNGADSVLYCNPTSNGGFSCY